MSDPYISQIIMFGGNFAIQNYARCDGQLLAIQQNDALFSLLGTTYGGDGQNTFGLPDLRGRVPISSGQSQGTSRYPLGARFGTETVTLTQIQLPSHSHAAMASSTEAGEVDPTNRVVAPGKINGSPVSQFTAESPTGGMAGQAVGQTGGNQPHDNMMPGLALNFQIALSGIYPSRS